MLHLLRRITIVTLCLFGSVVSTSADSWNVWQAKPVDGLQLPGAPERLPDLGTADGRLSYLRQMLVKADSCAGEGDMSFEQTDVDTLKRMAVQASLSVSTIPIWHGLPAGLIANATCETAHAWLLRDYPLEKRSDLTPTP